MAHLHLAKEKSGRSGSSSRNQCIRTVAVVQNLLVAILLFTLFVLVVLIGLTRLYPRKILEVKIHGGFTLHGVNVDPKNLRGGEYPVRVVGTTTVHFENLHGGKEHVHPIIPTSSPDAAGSRPNDV
jgi:hypothetical protein